MWKTAKAKRVARNARQTFRISDFEFLLLSDFQIHCTEGCDLWNDQATLGELGDVYKRHADIVLRTRMEPQEALDILNGMLDMGFVEISNGQQNHVTRWAFNTTMFEVNPAFVHDLKKALIRKSGGKAA